MNRYILSLWPLDANDQFQDTVPAWESQVLDQEQVQQAYDFFTWAVAVAIAGPHDTYNLSLDLLDQDGIGISQQIQTLRG